MTFLGGWGGEGCLFPLTDFVFVFITRPVNISDFNSIHFCLSLGCEFLKIGYRSSCYFNGLLHQEVPERPRNSFPNDASGLLFVTTQSIFLFSFVLVFLFNVGFTKEMTCNVLHVFISALDFVLNKSSSLLCLYLVVIFLVL